MDLLSGLNSAQERAVVHDKGPLIIIAGAGTGKTTVITRRIAYLIQTKSAKPSEILALTFTDKAAGEMEERVDQLVPYGFVDTWISTFHSFGDRLLRDHALEVGLSPNFQVLSEPEQCVFLRERIFGIEGLRWLRPLSGPTKHIPVIVNHISHLKDELIGPEKYLSFATKEYEKAETVEEKLSAEKYLEIAKIYTHYQAWMLETDQIDFGDQINLAIKLFIQHPDILKKYQRQFQYCLVDEFQDTNTAQNEIIKILFGPKTPRQNITVVGDDDQSIYQFRGAAVKNILGFQKTWSRVKVIALNQNFRSQQGILNSAYNLIQHNNPDRLETKSKISKKLVGIDPGPEPEFIQYEDDFHETKDTVNKIEQLVINGTPYSDIAILVRANSQAEPFIQQLRAAGLPYLAPGTSGLYDEPIVRLLISFSKVISDYDDYLSLYYLATSEIYKVDTIAMTALVSYVKHRNLHFRDVIAGLERHRDIAYRIKKEIVKLKKLNSDIEQFTFFARQHNVGEVIYKWLVETELLKKLDAKSNDDLLARVSLENIASFYEKIKNFVRASDNPNVMSFTANLRLLVEAGENPSTSQEDIELNAITILTVHSAKGLEWPIVFLPSLTADRFPSRHRQDPIPLSENLIKLNKSANELHLQEERRLFYVAMTRAKEQLHMSAAKKYGLGSREKKISQFVYEALNKIKLNVKIKKVGIIEKLSLFETVEKREVVKTRFIKNNNIKLNPHQIDDYLTCPKKFDYIHILRVPIIFSWEVAYGNAIHKAIGHYFTKKLKGQKINIDELIDVYNGAWRSENFVTREHEIEKKRIGQETLIEFYKREEKLNRPIKAVEERFEFAANGIKISGRYDTIFEKRGERTILDFKTSDVTEEKKASERVKQSTQMQIYALSEEVMRNKKPTTALYFVESGIVAEHKFTDKELDKTKENIDRVIRGIKEEDFSATPGYNQCHWCAYKDICPSKYRGA